MFKSVFKTGIRGVYNVSDNASFGTELWAIYPAKHKQTGKVVSVFIFEKPRFEAQVHRLCDQTSNTRNPRQIVAEFYDQIRAEISNLTKLKHPQILTVLEAMEETKLKFLFVTESVTANLETINFENETLLSIQKGLLELSKGLQFLHDTCSIIHMNLQPSSVFINAQGDWKLAGFKFLQNLNEMTPLDRENFYIMNSSSVIEAANRNLNFTAPELIIDSSGMRLSTANDMWSVGMLVYYLYNKGDQMIACFETSSISDFKSEFRKFEQRFYNRRPAELKYMFKDVPEQLWVIMTQLLARYPNDRMSIDQFIDSEFFDGSLIKMMSFIDEFSTKTLAEKVVFLDGLLGHSDLLLQLPSTFKNSKLLPLLVDSINSEISILQAKSLDSETDAFLSKSLRLVFAIGELLSNLSFQDRIYDKLLDTKAKKSGSNLVKLFLTSVKIRLAIIDHVALFRKKLQQKQITDIMKEVATLSVTASKNELDQQTDQIKLQDTYLSNLALVVDLFDFPYVKNTLFPLICQVFKTTTILSTKIQTIRTFDMLIENKIIDKVIVNDQLLPVLENLKSRDKRIVSAVIAFFVRLVTSTHVDLDLEVLVDKVLGQSLRLLFACLDCSKSEFEDMMVQLETIQTQMVKAKVDSLSDTSREPAKEDFSSLINNALIRQKSEEPSIKVPVLQPTSTSFESERKSANTQAKPQAKPLTLTPSRQTAAKPQGLRFGATSSTSNNQVNSRVLNSGQGSDWTSEPTLKPQITPSQNRNKNHAHSVDWSSAESLLNSAASTINTGLLKVPNNTSHRVASDWAPITSSSGPSLAKLPPGFSSDMILKPNSTGPSVAATNVKKLPDDLLDFL